MDISDVWSKVSPVSFGIIHGSGVYYTERKLKNKNGGGLGTRLV